MRPPTDFAKCAQVLLEGKVDFIVIGGVAGLLHGTSRVTFDFDVVYERSRPNLERLVAALAPYSPYLRGAPPGLPFQWDWRTLHSGLNFTLITSLGELDLLAEIAGGGRFEDLVPHSIELPAYGRKLRCLDLPKLIQVKRAAGRPKDFEAIAELELLLDLKRKNS